jgi:hypothetical protein
MGRSVRLRISLSAARSAERLQGDDILGRGLVWGASIARRALLEAPARRNGHPVAVQHPSWFEKENADDPR